MQLIRVCLLAAVVFGYLANAQQHANKPQRPTKPNEPQKPQRPNDPQRPQRPNDPQKPQRPNDPQRPQRPNDPQKPQPRPQKPSQNPQIAKPIKKPNEPDPHFHSCEVSPAERVQCGTPDVTRDGCEALSCCHDGSMCYYGHGVTFQCTKDGHFILVISRDVTLPSIDMDSIYFYENGDECLPVGVSSAFLIYMFPVTACGTRQTDEPGVVVYENRMYSSFEISTGDRGVITRDTTFDLIFQARYTGTSVETIIIEVGIVPAPLPASGFGAMNVALFLGSGQCTAKGCVEEDVAFNTYYADAEYPITKVLRESVYVEVAMLDRTDPNIVLNLGRCWVTAEPSPFSHPQWDLIIDGCPNRDDKYLTKLLDTSSLTFPGHYRRFVFKMFAFMSERAADPRQKVVQNDSPAIVPIDQLMYVHCETSVCKVLPGNNCEPKCFRKRRDVSSTMKRFRPESPIVTSGAISISSA